MGNLSELHNPDTFNFGHGMPELNLYSNPSFVDSYICKITRDRGVEGLNDFLKS